MVHQNRLLDVVKQDNLDAFITFMSSYRSSTDDDLIDVITSLSSVEQDELWEGLHRLCTNELLNVGKDAGASEISFSESNKTTVLLKYLTTLLSVYLPQSGKSLFDKSHVTGVEDEDRAVQIPGGILQTAIVMHELLPILPDHTDVIKNQLCRVFESWWKLGLEGKDELISNTLFYLLEKILDVKTVKTLIKRLWSVHEGFQHIDVNDSESPKVQILIRCFRHVPMLTVDEGRKFLSYLLSLDENLIDKIHPCIKNHIIAVPKFLLPKIGEVYYLAWKAVSGLALEKIERDCIQDLMYLAVHTNRASSNSLAGRLRKVLSYFQKQNGVPALLARLYEPFLWRSLKVANGHVRANSVALLLQAFPLLDPTATSKEKDTALQRQTDILQNLLHDPCIDVRCITVSGVCRILDLYWSTGLLPVDMIQAFLTRLVRELAWDVSSSLVRASVITGLTFLLNQHLSHPVLKQLLPELRDCVHDTSEKVRLSMMELLLKVKALQTIKFWNIVPPAHLLARLEIEQRPMATRIVRLLFASYIPADTSLHLDRCVSLIESNPGAARQFYNYAPKYMTLADCTAYMVLLCRCVLQCVRKFTPQNDDSINPDQQQSLGETDEGYDEGLSINDTQVMTGMLEAVALLWTPNVATLEKAENAELKRSLHRKFAVALHEFLQTFQEPAARQAIVIMCGYMPPELIPAFSMSVLSKLKDMSADDKAEDYAVLLDAMFNWGKMSHVLELVTDWLDESEPVYDNQELEDAQADKCAKVRKRVQIIDPRQPKPGLCVSFLSHVLTHQVHYQQLFTSNRTELLHIVDQLKNVTQRLVEKRCSCHTQQLASGWSDDVLIDAFLMYLKLTVILHKPDDSDENSSSVSSIGTIFESVFHWADTQLVPHLTTTSTAASDDDAQNKDETSSGKRKSPQDDVVNDLALKLIQVLLQLGSNVLLVGMADDVFAEQYTEFCIKLTLNDASRESLHLMMSGLYQLSEFYCTRDETVRAGQEIHSTPKTVETFYSKLLQKLAHVVEDEFAEQIKKTEQLLADLRLPFAEILQSVWKLQQCMSDTVMSEVMASTMAAVITNLTNHSAKNDLDEVPASLSELSPFSSFLLSGVFKHTYMSKALMEELYQCITCAAINTVHGLNATSFLLATLQKCHPSLPRLCECRLELRSQILDFKHSSMLQQPVFSIKEDNDDMPESALLEKMEKRLEDVDLL